MSPLETLLAQIIDLKKRLDATKEQSPEIADALALSDQYHGLMNDLREMCNPTPAIPQVMPMPYPVQPWESPATYIADNTASRPKLKLMIDGREIPRA